MKGQAFIGLPSEEAAMRALEETNGYTLHGRPMVVVSVCGVDSDISLSLLSTFLENVGLTSVILLFL